MTSDKIYRPAKAVIDTAALAHNFNIVRKYAGKSRVMSVIKANAYGHGVLQAAAALAESDAFAVASIDEALQLRKNAIQKTVVLLEGVFSVDEYRLCASNQFIPVVNSIEQIVQLDIFASQFSAMTENFEYWLKLDTGMHRLGLTGEELKSALSLLAQISSLPGPTTVISHFANADQRDNPLNQQQLEHFGRLLDRFELQQLDKSMANSAAILGLPESHYQWVRPGIMLYGACPDIDSNPGCEELQPVMTFSSELIAIKSLRRGDCVGYGSTWCCPEDMQIGVVAIGYGDGYPRHAGNGTPVRINGVTVPLVGRVSMDMITVDLRPFRHHFKSAKVGDRAILWGKELPVEIVAEHANTISYELLCQLTNRVSFSYVP